MSKDYRENLKCIDFNKQFIEKYVKVLHCLTKLIRKRYLISVELEIKFFLYNLNKLATCTLFSKFIILTN